MQTHLEPLAEEAPATRPRAAEVAGDAETVARIVRERDRRRAGELRFLHTDEGLVAYLTLRLDGASRSPTRTPRRAGSRS